MERIEDTQDIIFGQPATATSSTIQQDGGGGSRQYNMSCDTMESLYSVTMTAERRPVACQYYIYECTFRCVPVVWPFIGVIVLYRWSGHTAV